jgi:hypothetical protein
MIKSGRIRWVGYVACMKAMRNSETLGEGGQELKRRDHLENPDI